MNHFPNFNFAVNKQIAAMQKGQLFRSSVPVDLLWNTYLDSYPAGTNNIYRTRREYDCSCCKQFVRAVGNMVSIVDGQIVTIWDVKIKDEPNFQIVADALANLVKQYAIGDAFLHYEGHSGNAKTFEQLTGGEVHQWDHFHTNIDKKFVVKKDLIATKLSEIRSGKDVLLRSLKELDMESVDTVLDLIAQNSLYRGEEHKFAVTEFKKLKTAFDKFKGDPDVFVWDKIGTTAGSVARFRNSVIGTLVTDLSDGVDLEKAVKTFESKVAPSNYKRPTALVTKAMIEKAKATIAELGLTTALERRYANLSDISINNVLFANRSTKKAIMGDVFDEIATKTVSKKTLEKIEEVTIDKFISDILPRSTSIQLMVENTHVSNMVSLIAPVDPTAGRLFKWDNGFSWSYIGDVADSIKERVKAAGGNVTGELCCRLAWYNFDDLDFHMEEANGNEISFGNKRSSTGGNLDVDMNAGGGTTRTPVENIVYPQISKMPVGKYKLFVNMWSSRESKDTGFEVEIDLLGTTYSFASDKRMTNGNNITVAEFEKKKDGTLVVTSKLTGKTASKKVWNIDTMQFVNVNAMMTSPNHWDGAGIGNKHYFFMLDGCQNDGTARGFYNEFLREDLNAHRKVIEIVGSKMRTDETENQLSGVGFSSTQRNSVVLKVDGAFSRTIKVTF